MNVLLKVVKNIFCNEKYDDNCNKCSLCHLIDIRNLPTLRIIEPDGNFIKKDQILELKSLFSKSSQITDKSIYIILNCEKMNKESANTMLKFLEEPEDNIIGFFVTKDEQSVIPTIRSRCQIIKDNYLEDPMDYFNIDAEENEKLQTILLDYLEAIECKNNLIFSNEIVSGLEKSEIVILFQMMKDIYEKALVNRNSNLEFINKLSFKNKAKKIKLIIEVLKEMNYNINADLLLDKFVLEMSEINNETI